MADFVKKPDCCQQFVGQLFARIAEGNGVAFFHKLCSKCRDGFPGHEVIVDFSDGELIRNMSAAMLRQFLHEHAPSWEVVIIDHGSSLSVPARRDVTPLAGPMQAAWDAATQPSVA